mmetsp:Transcript_26060/g.53822  ORF Transcript_26060/g.53822 Transcript_26060/m.53822 type:complete len:94 (-) Transcript_26060:277-558(-)
MTIENRPIRHAQDDADPDPDAPRVKYVCEILEEVSVDPSDGAKQDDYVVKEIFREFLPFVVHFLVLTSCEVMTLKSWSMNYAGAGKCAGRRGS